MTDKQIIIDENKFEKAENEPINQEAVNKFIEETDKFYVVEGIDISKCEYRSKLLEGVCTFYGRCANTFCPYKANWLKEQLKHKEQECENLQGEISHYEHDLGWCSSLIEVYEEKIMKCFYALHQIQLHNLKIKDKDIDLILKEVKEDLEEYNKIKKSRIR